VHNSTRFPPFPPFPSSTRLIAVQLAHFADVPKPRTTAMASTNAPMDEKRGLDEKPRMEKRTSDADSESVHSEKTKVEVPVLKYDERHW
jgi:hypothetical protein